jgi:hypothetical protein
VINPLSQREFHGARSVGLNYFHALKLSGDFFCGPKSFILAQETKAQQIGDTSLHV